MSHAKKTQAKKRYSQQHRYRHITELLIRARKLTTRKDGDVYNS